MAWYRTGTISVTNGSPTVTGSGTAWISNAAVGEALYGPDGRLYEISNIGSDASITLASNYLGTNQSGQAYVIVPSQSYIRDLAAQAASLVNNYSTVYNTVGQGKFSDGTLAAPGIRFADNLNTGFYRSATNEVTFVANGVAQFKYNATTGLTMSSGLSISRTAVTSPAASDGNVFSGTYVPSLTNTTNVAASTAYSCQYMRVGNVVTVSGQVDIDPTAAGAVVLRMSLPITSSFTATRQAGGAGGTAAAEAVRIAAIASTSVVGFYYTATSTANNAVAFTFTYQIV